MSADEYRTTIGRTGDDLKVHLAHGIGTQRALCRPSNNHIVAELAEIPADNADVCTVLLTAEVKTSHLCRHCFAVRTRARYSATIKAAIAALPTT
jgi:hypothetical protein